MSQMPHIHHSQTGLLSPRWITSSGTGRLACHGTLFTQKAINTEMIDFVYRNSKTFDSIRPRIEAMVAKDWQKLQMFSDIPAGTFRRLWNGVEINISTPPDTARGMAEKPNQKASKPKQSTRSKKDPLKTPSHPSLDENFQESQIRSLALAAKQADV
jgi:hypothetical protein